MNAGGVFLDQAAVVDGHFITSRGPSDVLEFMVAIDHELSK
ncbi:MAG: hypothetical protein HOE90_18900 [Bacteriovoracaceae bacterium]|nr:hypothetical protein [Bacteriovoracaceae bacterium]